MQLEYKERNMHEKILIIFVCCLDTNFDQSLFVSVTVLAHFVSNYELIECLDDSPCCCQ